MKVSDLLKKFPIAVKYQIINDKEVETLALSEADISKPYCTFIDDEKYIDNISQYARMIITKENVYEKIKGKVIGDVGFCIVDNPRNTFFKLHNELKTNEDYIRHNFKTHIGEGCQISKLASIDENNVVIGDNVIIEEFVVIRENTVIGDNCIIRAGVKLGGNDFEFKKENDTIFGVNHYGGLIIEKEVEIQYDSCINRALYPWDNTVVGEYTKIDTHVVISHGVKVGKCSMITSKAVIGGRTIIGNNCWIGLAATIRNGIKIGDNARVNMGAVVTKDVRQNESVSGNFAIEHKKFIEQIKRQI